MAIYTPGRATLFGQLPDTPADELLGYADFLGLMTQECEEDAREQVFAVLKYTVMAVSALVCAPHAMEDFLFQLLPLNTDQCTRDVLMAPRYNEDNPRTATLHMQLSTSGELLYATDVSIRAYFPKLL